MRNSAYLREFSKIDYSLQDIESLYQHYIENLAMAIQLPGTSSYFLDISTAEYRVGSVCQAVMPNPFVENDIRKFGIDLEKNGTYWVFIFFDGKLKEGMHRAYALKAISSHRRFLCWDIPRNLIKNSLPEKKEFKVLFPESYFNCIKWIPPFCNSVRIADNLYSVPVKDYDTAFSLMVYYSMYLSEQIIRYRSQFIPSRIINDPDTFYQWRCNQDENSAD
jgi:hypothetical protein